jgi:hypothetical protein
MFSMKESHSMKVFLTLNLILFVCSLTGARRCRAPSMTSDYNNTGSVVKERQESESEQDKLRDGDIVEMKSITYYDTVLVFANERAYEDAFAESHDRRLGLINQMIDTGRVFQAAVGAECILVEKKKFTLKDKTVSMVKVGVLKGPLATKVSWVYQSEVVKKEG